MLSSIFVMGGSLIGRGNASPCAEYNFLSDPEAAHIVIDAFTAKQLVLITWETTEKVCSSCLSLSQLHLHLF